MPENDKTAADKLRELLATRPAMPNTEQLVSWWRTSAELVREVLRERSELISDLVVADKRTERERAAVDVLKQEARELEQQRDALRRARDPGLVGVPFRSSPPITDRALPKRMMTSHPDSWLDCAACVARSKSGAEPPRCEAFLAIEEAARV